MSLLRQEARGPLNLIQSAYEPVDGNDALLHQDAAAPKTNRLRCQNESGRLHLQRLLRIRATQSLGSDNRLSPDPSLAPRKARSSRSQDSFASENAVQIASYPIGGEIVAVVLRTSAGRERVLFHALSLKPIGFAQAAPMAASWMEGN